MNDLDEKLAVKGDVELIVTDSNGVVKESVLVKNLVVSAGKSWIASRMVDGVSTLMSHMAVGTGSTAPATGNTALVTETARVALTLTSAAANQITYSAFFAPGVGTGALVEAGILNAASGGTMLCRTTFGAVNKSAPDSLTINWTITII